MPIPPLPPLRVREADGSPNVIPVFEIIISGATVTRAGNGVQILMDSGAGATGAPVGSQYVTMALDATLTGERTLAAGTGLTLTDAGANSAATIAMSVPVAVTSGGTSTTTHTAFGLLYGSGASAIQALAALKLGQFVVGSSAVTKPVVLDTGTVGQMLISSAGNTIGLAWVNTLGGASATVYAATGNPYLTYDAAGDLTAERVLTSGTGLSVASDATNFFVSMVTPVSVSSGGTSTTTHTAFGLLYGSGGSAIQALPAMALGQLVVGSSTVTKPVLFNTGAAGTMLISSGGNTTGLAWVASGGGGASVTYAATGNPYLTFDAAADLTNERVVLAGTGLAVASDATNFFVSMVTPVSVSSGGTSTTTHTAFGLLYGSGASAIQALPALNLGQLVVGSSTVTKPVAFNTGSVGQMLISSGGNTTGLAWVNTLGGGASVTYAATGNAYLTFDAASDLTNERIVTSGTGIAVASDATNFFVSLVTPVSATSGGTGLSSLGSGGMVLGVRTDGAVLEYKNIAGGTNVTVTHGGSTITITATTGGAGTGTVNTGSATYLAYYPALGTTVDDVTVTVTTGTGIAPWNVPFLTVAPTTPASGDVWMMSSNATVYLVAVSNSVNYFVELGS